MNKKWERKPRDQPIFREHRNEDGFLCHKCKQYWPWFLFDHGKKLFIPNNIDNVYAYMNDDLDRGGRIWACNFCIDKVCSNNSICLIYDKNGKLITYT